MPDDAAALLVLWNDVASGGAADYEAWHAREHVPERLTVPGILWARRYGRCGGLDMPRYLTLYGLRDPSVLDSEPYQALLSNPTPMSRRMRPLLVNVSRWVCRLVVDEGAAATSHLALRTLADGVGTAAAMKSLQSVAGAAGRLLAHRLESATPLPWLSAAQASGLHGEWLLGFGFDAGGDLEARSLDVSLYARLPVG